MYSNYGDLCSNVKDEVEKYEGMKARHADLSSVEAMQNAFMAMPALQKKGFTVSKHLALVTEMNKEIDRKNLLALCEIEQNLVVRIRAAVHVGGRKFDSPATPPHAHTLTHPPTQSFKTHENRRRIIQATTFETYRLLSQTPPTLPTPSLSFAWSCSTHCDTKSLAPTRWQSFDVWRGSVST